MIQKLSKEVSSAIAAGEVIERPASAVKELVENSLDASASAIDVRIAGGGKTLIEVSDNGEGSPAEQLAVAVQRYSTSKLHTIDDLRRIGTLGFRGEALASIGAVSHLEIVSRSSGSNSGARLIVDVGQTQGPEPVAAPPGTQIRVSELFHNVPARLRFLKTDQTERGWIQRIVSRHALGYPQVRGMSMVRTTPGVFSPKGWHL